MAVTDETRAAPAEAAQPAEPAAAAEPAERSRPPGPAQPAQPAERSRPAERIVLAGLGAFAVYHLALAVFMAAAPRAFYDALGPFGLFNSHYIRDTASFEAALGFGLLVAIRRASWRVPMLAIVTVQFALHSANHLLDIGSAHPHWTGYFDFFALLASTALLARLWHLAARPSRPTGSPPLPSPPSPRRST